MAGPRAAGAVRGFALLGAMDFALLSEIILLPAAEDGTLVPAAFAVEAPSTLGAAHRCCGIDGEDCGSDGADCASDGAE